MRFLSTIIIALFCNIAGAGVITIDTRFSSFDAVFDGVLQPTGAFDLRIVTDTTNPNLGPAFTAFDNGYAADVYVDAPMLGLNNARITSPTFLFFGPNQIGISNEPDVFGTMITSYVGPQLAFGSRFDLSTLVVPQGPSFRQGTEFRTMRGPIEFDNGSAFDTSQFLNLRDQQNVVTVRAGAVPEPASTAVFGILAILAITFRRRSGATQSSNPR